MKQASYLLFLMLQFICIPGLSVAAGGITPEQIFQHAIEWKQLIGTWEVLPDDNPLAEKSSLRPKSAIRTLMTLRKDGTCRIFDESYPTGSDGMWTFEDHSMFITFPGGQTKKLYIYGIRLDFMITRAAGTNTGYVLWSRVK